MKLPKAYDPAKYESNVYTLWEKSNSFVPKNRDNDKNFSIVIPPPNANGNLHLGHGLNHTIMDIAVRYHRMRGEAALLLPGADHAGFETQVVYEKQLATKGKSRFDYSREELYSQIWDFVAKNRKNYETQFRRLGDSVDWNRYVFTLDDKIIDRAYKTFKKMWDEGLIYRGERLVNFCTFHGTGFADIEVSYKEVEGHIWYIRYPLTDGQGSLVVATTRPETMLGDTAVAVHPDDKRYKNLIGKTVKLPLTNREIPVIADDFVDSKFGTGAVKITPAHDPNDFEIGQRHDLPMISVINHEGKLSHIVPKSYRDLSVLEARESVVKDLGEQGFLEKIEDHIHSVGHCYKCDTVIEPLLRKQWFIDMKPLSTRAIKALNDNKIKFYPENKKKQLIEYLKGLHDWNISRQIAWGIPIPAFQNSEDPDDWIYNDRANEETIEVNGKKYHRDPDVFDTWFSSSSWPYATLDYPDGEDFGKFYPISVMETGADILYPWVSRMIMFGLYITDQVPFTSVYLHGLVQDEHGQKMSKSKGNVIDPIQEIDQYGADAFRMGMIAVETAGNNRPFDPSKLIGARNFCNKLWNVARFIESKASNYQETPQPTTSADHWLLSKLQHSTEKISKNLDNYRFAEAYDEIYHLLWDDFADWYIEASKQQTNLSILVYGLETILKLTHPFAPFVTEAIWQTLGWKSQSILATESWPAPIPANSKLAVKFDNIISTVGEIRYLNTELQLSKPTLLYKASKISPEELELIKHLSKLGNVIEVEQGSGLKLAESYFAAWLDIDQSTLENYSLQISEKLAEQSELVANLRKRLSNKSYINKAPAAIVDQTKQQLQDAETRLDKLTNQQKRLTQ